MALQEKQIGQANPATGGAAVSLYSPASGTTAIIKGLFITNVTTTEVTVSIYVDDDGTTYDSTTAIILNMNLPAGQFVDISTFIAMNNANGNIAVECDTGNGATFTAFGGEIT